MNAGEFKKLLESVPDDMELVGMGAQSYYKIEKIEACKAELVDKVVGSKSRKVIVEYLDEASKEDPKSAVIDVLVIA